MNKKLSKYYFLIIILFGIATFLLNIGLGSVNIPLAEIYSILLNENFDQTNQIILFNYRIPKAITTILVGISLPLCGMMMQTLFRNPLAGPYILGITSGASLGVAILFMCGSLLPSFLIHEFSQVIFSILGSLFVLLLVLQVSFKVKEVTTILLVGIMFGSFSSAIVTLITSFSNAENLQKFTFWSMGNLGNLSTQSLQILTFIVFMGAILCFITLKSLNGLILGENYAKSMGISIQKSRFFIILATSILAGSVTAFVGPIAFIGLAVPHIAKIIFKTSNHFILFWANIGIGIILMLLCDILTFILFKNIILPINAITSILGAPLLVYLLLKKNKWV
jgi:iron complex transport system permease protein